MIDLAQQGFELATALGFGDPIGKGLLGHGKQLSGSSRFQVRLAGTKAGFTVGKRHLAISDLRILAASRKGRWRPAGIVPSGRKVASLVAAVWNTYHAKLSARRKMIFLHAGA